MENKLYMPKRDLTFTPRNPKSKWSKPNRERAERMMEKGLMTPYGQQLIDMAKDTGKWEPIGTKSKESKI